MSDYPRRWNMALVGFGTVGQAFARLVLAEYDRLLAEEGVDIRVTALVTRRSGSVRDLDGLDLASLLEHAARGLAYGRPTDAAKVAATADAQVIIETLPLEPRTGDAAIAVTRAALDAGRHVVSANKGPVAHALQELRGLARRRGVRYRFEAAVADGLPVFSLMEYALPAVRIERIVAALNSTSNLVLAALLEGERLEDGIERARRAGVAESNVTYDLDGWDAAVKLCALSNAVLGKRLALPAIERASVQNVTAERVSAARERGARLMSIATLTLEGPGPVGSVRIEEVAPACPFYALSGTSLGLRLESPLICPITVSACQPTPADTAYGLLADVLHIAHECRRPRHGGHLFAKPD